MLVVGTERVFSAQRAIPVDTICLIEAAVANTRAAIGLSNISTRRRIVWTGALHCSVGTVRVRGAHLTRVIDTKVARHAGAVAYSDRAERRCYVHGARRNRGLVRAKVVVLTQLARRAVAVVLSETNARLLRHGAARRV